MGCNVGEGVGVARPHTGRSFFAHSHPLTLTRTLATRAPLAHARTLATRSLSRTLATRAPLAPWPPAHSLSRATLSHAPLSHARHSLTRALSRAHWRTRTGTLAHAHSHWRTRTGARAPAHWPPAPWPPAPWPLTRTLATHARTGTHAHARIIFMLNLLTAAHNGAIMSID